MRRMIASAAVVAVTLLGVQAPARAAQSDCWANTICLFAHANFGLPIWRQTEEQVQGCVTLYGFNDVTSHVMNRIPGATATFYWDGGCQGANFSLSSGTNANLGTTGWNDELSSLRLTLV